MNQNSQHRRLLRAVGDCNTQAANELPASASVPAQLVATLEANGESYELENLGAAMNTTREGIARLRACNRPADLLLINFGLVDAWQTSMPWCYVSYYPDNPVKKSGRKLLKAVKRRLRAPWIRRIVGVGFVVPELEFRENLIRMVQIERERNPDVEILFWGSVVSRNSESRNTDIRRYNETVAAVAHACSCRYFDSNQALTSLTTDEIYLDDVHLTEFAAGRIADQIQTELSSGSRPLLRTAG